MKLILLFLITFNAFAYPIGDGNRRKVEANQIINSHGTEIDFLDHLNMQLNNILGVGDLTVTGTTTLDTGLTGPLKAAAGVVSASAIELASEVNGILPVANGGTNSSTALNNDFIMISSAGSIVESSVVSVTEANFLDNIAENIQTSLNAKALQTIDLQVTAPITGGGDLSANRTFGITQATTSTDGYLSSTDWNTFNNKGDALPSGTNGDILYYNSGWQVLPIGTNDQILKIISQLPSWEDETGGGGSPTFTTVTKSSTATLATTGEDNVVCSTSGGSVTLNLPATSGNNGVTYKITNLDDANPCTIDPNAAETINGNSTYVMRGIGESIIISNDGTSWRTYSTSDRKTKSCYVTNSGTPTTADTSCDSWVTSITDNGTGDATLNFYSGTFSGAVICVANNDLSNLDRTCKVGATSSTTARVYCGDSNNVPVLEDRHFTIICTGAY